jgi:hypothetical protein
VLRLSREQERLDSELEWLALTPVNLKYASSFQIFGETRNGTR